MSKMFEFVTKFKKYKCIFNTFNARVFLKVDYCVYNNNF